jgi:hypothetical protein
VNDVHPHALGRIEYSDDLGVAAWWVGFESEIEWKAAMRAALVTHVSGGLSHHIHNCDCNLTGPLSPNTLLYFA